MAEPLVQLIDHAVLQATQTDEDLQSACSMCAELKVASVCVKPSHVWLASKLLAGSDVFASTVIGFPHGGTTTKTKVAETDHVCQQGAREVDMVVNIGKVLSEDWDYVRAEIEAVVVAAREHDALTKVIFETGLLRDDSLKIRLCEISEASGAAFVKTSTGFGFVKDDQGRLISTGATEHDIRLMRAHCSAAVGVKASGGVRTFEDARRFVELGASRLGTSGTKAIAEGAASDSSY